MIREVKAIIVACIVGMIAALIGIFASVPAFPDIPFVNVVLFWATAAFCLVIPVIAYIGMGIAAGGWVSSEDKGSLEDKKPDEEGSQND